MAKTAGIFLMALAFFQWITFEYPNVNPFGPGAIFAPGMVSQILNWLLVCILGSIGYGLFTIGSKQNNNSNKQ